MKMFHSSGFEFSQWELKLILNRMKLDLPVGQTPHMNLIDVQSNLDTGMKNAINDHIHRSRVPRWSKYLYVHGIEQNNRQELRWYTSVSFLSSHLDFSCSKPENTRYFNFNLP